MNNMNIRLISEGYFPIQKGGQRRKGVIPRD